MWYNDTSNCSNSTGMPANVTFSCDYDGNGLIGSFNSFSESNIDLDIYINGILGNNSMNYTGTKKIDFKENGVLRLTFNYSFDNPLDLRGVSIGIQDVDSSYGYIIVRGINITKSVWVDKINLSSNKVCIKNSDGNISSLTENCTATNEHLVDCPGSDGNLKCSINGSYFVVSGLTRSIVMEWLKDVEDVTCQTNWSCTLWSSCSNGNMSRICTDKSYCNVTVDKPAIIQSCSVSVCNVNWNCSNWGPEKCPSSLTQTRTCKDLSFCNVSSGKPPISRTCEMEKKSWTPIIVIAIVILLLIIVVIVMIMKFKGKKDDSSYVNIQNMPRSPPGSPISPRAYAPIVARPSPAVIQPKPMSLPQPKPLMPGTPFRQY